MPKTKTLSAPVVEAGGEPRHLINVGPPHMPALYRMKSRKEYLPWSHARERLTVLEKLLDLHGSSGRASALDTGVGFLDGRCPLFRHGTDHAKSS
jgi:hypothetical protein